MLASEIFLRPLADRFVRLALQLLARYTSWLSEGLQQPEAEPAPAQEGAAEQVHAWAAQ